MPPKSRLPAELLERPFRASDAVALGGSEDVLRGRRFRAAISGVYVSAEVPDTLACRVDAALLVMPPASVISHHTAAALRGLPVPASDTVHVTSTSRGAGRGGITRHLGSPSAVRRDGRLLSPPLDNFLELAATLSLVDLVVLGDAMVRHRFVTCDELVEAARTSRRRRGIVLARRAAALVRPRVDSPMETRVRLLVVLAGLPEPSTNLEIRDHHGGWVGRADLVYPAYKLIIEYDGDLHRTERKKWRVDVATRETYRHELGFEVLVLTGQDVFLHPQQTIWRVRDALRRRGHPGVPAVLSGEWRCHLPPRPAAERPWV